jgi:hypothetical protein
MKTLQDSQQCGGAVAAAVDVAAGGGVPGVVCRQLQQGQQVGIAADQPGMSNKQQPPSPLLA